MKLLLDMNISLVWVDYLKDQGYEAIHWSTVGDPKARDIDIMQWAAENEYVVFTHDLDFSTLLAVTGSTGPSVIQARAQDVLPSAIGESVVGVLRSHEAAIQKGAIVTVDVVSSRVRLLPIRRDPNT